MLVNKHKAAEAIGMSAYTLGEYRRDGLLTEGIHYHCWSSRTIRYNLDFVIHWALHRNDPATHQKWIEQQLQAQNKGIFKSRFPSA
ncbi:MAG: hypothetical protein KME13_23815 [Myxacorys californica WJT36-NPBG1]|jgi:hypothetical protein|nr:hypothetical protein [Myxacorys californica WJT36-NPBG1]